MGADRTDRRPRSLPRPSRRIPVRRFPASSIVRPARTAWLAGIGCLALAAPALAEQWRVTANAGITETYSSNVNYTAAGPAEPDFATTITGAIGISGTGARARLNGSIGASAILYAKESQLNSFAPNVAMTGSVEAVENFFFVDAAANISQTFFSPFGPQPGNIVNATANRYTAQTYSVSPYIRGRIPGTNLTYQLRDDNIWTLSSQFGDASVEAPNTYFNGLNGSINSPIAPWGYTVELSRNHYAPTNQDTFGSYTVELIRGILQYQVDPQLQVS